MAGFHDRAGSGYLKNCNGSAGMNLKKSLSLRETADTTKRVSAPPAGGSFYGPWWWRSQGLASPASRSIPIREDSGSLQSAHEGAAQGLWVSDSAVLDLEKGKKPRSNPARGDNFALPALIAHIPNCGTYAPPAISTSTAL
jgi:hypothetical protein